MRRFTHLVVLAAFIFSCGGQWYALQCVAWIKMIHDYSQMVPFTEAVNMTFSGKYPCAICKALAEKQAADNDKLLAFEKFEKKVVASMCVIVPLPRVATFSYPELRHSLRFWNDIPPVPPPRLALG